MLCGKFELENFGSNNMLQVMFFSPLIAALIAVGAVVLARTTGKQKAKVITLVVLSLLFAIAGAGVSLIYTIDWMASYEESTGYSAGNAPLGWMFSYGPVSAALGQLLALAVWWFKKPDGTGNGNIA